MKKLINITGACILSLFMASNSYAALMEYSISGNAYFYEYTDGGEISGLVAKEITGSAIIDDNKTPYYSPGDPGCPSGPGAWSCDTRFDFTYFDMYVDTKYHFFGDSGYIQYTNSDTYGALYGDGDWSTISHSSDSDYLAPILNYEEWLAFELPDVISWESTGFDGEVVANDPSLEGQVYIMNISLTKQGPIPVSETPAFMLLAVGLIGLGFVRNNKRC